jgi:hypothetical protein
MTWYNPDNPVYIDHLLPDGAIGRSFISTSRPVSTMTDEQLDRAMAEILEVFPFFGQKMIIGRLKDAGHHVP